jgi:hypothetical protein
LEPFQDYDQMVRKMTQHIDVIVEAVVPESDGYF